MTNSARNAIAVLGCHRSGTSLITRSLVALGAVLGEDLLQPLADNNVTGFWEDRELHLMLQDMQHRAGSDWDELSYGFDAHHRYVSDAALQKVTDLLDAKTSEHYLFAFKNPRLALIIGPFKRAMQALNIVPAYVVVVRDPLSVAESLYERDGIPLAHGVLLWLKYMIESVAAVDKGNAVFVHYERMLEAPEQELLRIEQALDVSGLRLRPAELASFRDEFVDIELRHHHHDDDELAQSPEISDDILSAYQDLCAAASADAASGPTLSKSLWKRLEREFAQQAGAWRHIDEVHRNARAASAEATRLGRELAQARDDHDEQQERVAAASKRADEESQRLIRALEAVEACLRSVTAASEVAQSREQELDAKLAERSRELEELTAANEELVAERDEARDQASVQAAAVASGEGIKQERDHLEVLTAQFIAERDYAHEMLAEQTAAATMLTDQVHELRASLGALHASTSWQLSRPVRVVGDVVKRVRRRP